MPDSARSSATPAVRLLRLKLGRAGSGKTHSCLNEIAERLLLNPRGRPLLFLVPEQASAAMEHRLATMPGVVGFTRARVITFRHLASEILDRAGGRRREMVDEETRALLIGRILRRHRGDLRAFRSSAEMPGTARAVSESLLELRRYGWDRGGLEAKAGGGESDGPRRSMLELKLHDLNLVWREYDRLLAEGGLTDASELTDLAAGRVARFAPLEGLQLWMDGFASFTVQEMRFVEALMGVAESAAVALCLDPDDPFFRGAPDPDAGDRRLSRPRPILPRIGHERVFETVERTCAQLTAMASRLGWEVVRERLPREDQPTRFAYSLVLGHLESRVLTRLNPDLGPDADWTDEQVAIGGARRGVIDPVRAEDRRGEVEAAARTMLSLSVSGAEGGPVAWSEMAVIVRDLEPYADLIREIFTRYGIPFFLDQRRTLAAHPLARLILAALSLVRRGWHNDAISDWLRTGLLPCDDADLPARIESFARERRLRGGEWVEAARWTESKSEPDRSEAARLWEAWNGIIEPVRRLRAELEPDSDVAPARAVWNLIEPAAGRIAEWIESERAAGREEAAMTHEAAWRETLALLERVNRVGADPGADESDAGSEGETQETSARSVAAALHGIIESGFKNMLTGLIPPSLDEVIVGAIDRSRLPELRAAFVLGMAEGEFPRATDENAILGDEDRRRLAEEGSALGPDSRARFSQERYLAYIALTRSSQYLFISHAARAQNADDGAGGGSSFFRAVTEAFPLAVVRNVGRDGRTMPPQREGEDAAIAEASEPVREIDWAREIAAGVHLARRGTAPESVRASLAALLAGPPPLSIVREFARGPEAGRDARRAFAAAGMNAPARIDPALMKLWWGDAPTISITALETHARCPYQFFGGRMLGLRPAPEELPGPLEFGSLRHHVLDALFRRLRKADGTLDWGEVEPETTDRLIGTLTREAATRHLRDVFGRDSLTEGLVDLIAAELRVFVRGLRAMGARSRFVQADSERRFDAATGTVRIRAEANGADITFNLRGSIDRVDRLAEGDGRTVLIFDYKSSARSFDPTRFEAGVDLQLAGYGMVARDANGPHSTRVGGIFYWPLNLSLPGAGEPDEAAAEAGGAAWFERHRPRGLFDTDLCGTLDTGVKAGESALAFKFKLKKGKGEPAKTGDHLAAHELNRVIDRAGEIMGRTAARIADGRIEVRPVRLAGSLACDHCDLISLCGVRFSADDPARNPPKLKREDILRESPSGTGASEGDGA